MHKFNLPFAYAIVHWQLLVAPPWAPPAPRVPFSLQTRLLWESSSDALFLALSLSHCTVTAAASWTKTTVCLSASSRCLLTWGFASVSRPVDSVDYSISLWSVKLRKQFQLSPKARCRPRQRHRPWPRPRPSTRPRQTRWQRVKKGNSKK